MKIGASIITIKGIPENMSKHTRSKHCGGFPPHLVVRKEKEVRNMGGHPCNATVFVNRVASLTRPRIHWSMREKVEEKISIGLLLKWFG